MSVIAATTLDASVARFRACLRQLSEKGRKALQTARRHFAPPDRLTLIAWAEKYRLMHSGPLKGNLFRVDEQPALRGILAACDDPLVRELWCIKSAQIGWTQGVVMNYIFRHVHLDPIAILILFAKEGAGDRFMLEKVEPAVRAVKELRDRIRLEARSKDNTKEKKAFPGGYIQLVSSRSASNMKSTDFPLVVVEEPDDTAKNVQNQGDAIAIARERIKSFWNGRMLVGGTPTVKGLSKIEAGMERTDKRRMFVQCPHCDHEQPLYWERVRCADDAEVHHPIYGTKRPETARYACEACGVDQAPELWWTDAQKNAALLQASHRPDHGWRATAPFTGVAGVYLSDLYSVFAGARLELMMVKYLEADQALKNGDDTLMRAFRNNQLGEGFEIKGDAPEIVELESRGDSYAQWVAPAEALIATCFVDVQRGGQVSGAARLEYLIVGWGRNEESWRIARGKVLGNPLELATWDSLDAELARPIRSVGGGALPIVAMGVDSGDGMTQEAVYRYARAKRREGRDVIATKGANQKIAKQRNVNRPIFTPPKPQDTNNQDKASKYGLKLYMIGASAAKDTIAGRLKLTGRGPYRMHWPRDIGNDYFLQITAEVKVPSANGTEIWMQLANRANEMLDCEVGNLHLAHKLQLRSKTESWWQERESLIRQPSLLQLPASNEPVAAGVPAHVERRPSSPSTPAAQAPFRGFGRR